LLDRFEHEPLEAEPFLSCLYAIYSLNPKIFATLTLQITFDHSSYSKYLRKYKNNYDILKIYTMIKHVITK
jgi:hypothetical protein